MGLHRDVLRIEPDTDEEGFVCIATEAAMSTQGSSGQKIDYMSTSKNKFHELTLIKKDFIPGMCGGFNI